MNQNKIPDELKVLSAFVDDSVKRYHQDVSLWSSKKDNFIQKNIIAKDIRIQTKDFYIELLNQFNNYILNYYSSDQSLRDQSYTSINDTWISIWRNRDIKQHITLHIGKARKYYEYCTYDIRPYVYMSDRGISERCAHPNYQYLINNNVNIDDIITINDSTLDKLKEFITIKIDNFKKNKQIINENIEKWKDYNQCCINDNKIRKNYIINDKLPPLNNTIENLTYGYLGGASKNNGAIPQYQNTICETYQNDIINNWYFSSHITPTEKEIYAKEKSKQQLSAFFPSLFI